MSKKLVFLSTVTSLMAMALFAITFASLVQAREVKLAHLAPVNDPRHESLEQFAKMIEERTKGEITVKIFPKSQLGKDREIFEQLQGGLIQKGGGKDHHSLKKGG